MVATHVAAMHGARARSLTIVGPAALGFSRPAVPLEKVVVRLGDSVTVVLRLNDAGGDSVVGRASATRVAREAAQAGLDAVNQLLPRLLAPGQRMGYVEGFLPRESLGQVLR